MNTLNLTLDAFKIPALPDVSPEFGTKKESGGLSTHEVNDNMMMPFKKQRSIIISSDSLLTTIEYDAKILLNGENLKIKLGTAAVGIVITISTINEATIIYSDNEYIIKPEQIASFMYFNNKWNLQLSDGGIDELTKVYPEEEEIDNKAIYVDNQSKNVAIKNPVNNEQIDLIQTIDITFANYEKLPDEAKDSDNVIYHIIDKDPEEIELDIIDDEEVSDKKTWSSEQITNYSEEKINSSLAELAIYIQNQNKLSDYELLYSGSRYSATMDYDGFLIPHGQNRGDGADFGFDIYLNEVKVFSGINNNAGYGSNYVGTVLPVHKGDVVLIVKNVEKTFEFQVDGAFYKLRDYSTI